MRPSRGRIDGGEWLDEGRLTASEVAANLRDLDLINRFLGGTRSVLGHVPRALEGVPRGLPVRALDLACGGGDLLRALAQEMRRRGRTFAGVGVDANPQVLAYARERSRALGELDWVRADARRLPFPPQSFDLVVCATFLHHLPPAEVRAFLDGAVTVSRGWLIVADLVRSRAARAGFDLVARSLRLSPVTRHDGAVSLQRAYRPQELRQFAAAAGLTEARVARHPFSRMALVCRGNGAGG